MQTIKPSATTIPHENHESIFLCLFVGIFEIPIHELIQKDRKDYCGKIFSGSTLTISVESKCLSKLIILKLCVLRM